MYSKMYTLKAVVAYLKLHCNEPPYWFIASIVTRDGEPNRVDDCAVAPLINLQPRGSCWNRSRSVGLGEMVPVSGPETR